MNTSARRGRKNSKDFFSYLKTLKIQNMKSDQTSLNVKKITFKNRATVKEIIRGI